ncbi:hypothetical protein AALO_G00161460 [Alosa alosa]|uniref:Ig-like domain-containing protein n=1 Tax=Alosa alosa TaxID=278164 RepID=A0AAV6GEX3_9TELE|nr:hypothetical protein AALO_G00161460 [Alosa alosa]
MDSMLLTVVISLICVKFICLEKISVAEVELKVRPGDDIILYCDFSVSSKLEIEWHRKCTHVNQPELVLFGNFENPFPRFGLKWNISTKSVDLSIQNFTEHDLGLYHCEGKTKGIAINVLFEDPSPQPTGPPPDHDQCWILLVSLCPVCVFLCAISVYCFIREKESENKKIYQTFTGTADSTTTVVIYTHVDQTDTNPST